MAKARRVPSAEVALVTALAVLAVLVRWAGRRYQTSDLDVFIAWYDDLRAHGGIRGLRYEIGNYNAPFLYLFVLAIPVPLATLAKIKIIFTAFDVLLVFFTYRIVALRYSGWRIPFLAAAVVAFLPTVVTNASMYGQCDSIYASFTLGAIYCLLRGRPWWACTLFGLALAYKPQAIFAFPLLLLLLLAGRVPWRAVLAVAATYLVLDVPALLLGRDAQELLSIYARQAGGTGALTLNAPSIHQFFPVTVGADEIRAMANLFTAVLVLGVCYVLVASRVELTAERIIVAGALLAILVPMLLPAMHERYFYLADVLSVIAAFYRPRLWYLPVLVQASSFLSYLPFLFPRPSGPFVDQRILTTLMLAALLAVGRDLMGDMAFRRGVADGRGVVNGRGVANDRGVANGRSATTGRSRLPRDGSVVH